MRKSLGTQLFSYILIGTLVSLLSISGFFYKILEQRAQSSIESTLHTQAVMVENKIQQVEQQLQDIAAVTRSLKQNKIENAEAYQDVILSLFEQRSSIITAFGVGQTQRALLGDRDWFWPYFRINHHDNRDLGQALPAPHENLRYWDVSEDHYEEKSYYLDPLKKGQNYWIEPYSWHGFTMTTFTGPVRDLTNKIIGVVGIDISLDAFEEQIDHPVVSGKGSFAILSDEGNLLAYPADPEKSKTLASYQDFPGLATLWPQMQQSRSGLLLQDKNFWAYRRIPETGWLMVAAVPQAVVMLPVIRITLIGVIGACLILASITALFIYRLNQRLNPIIERCKSMMGKDSDRIQRLEGSELKIPATQAIEAKFEGLDEIGVLDLSFMEMSQQLQGSMETLEARVEERTADLQQAKNEAEKAKNTANAANEAKSEFLANMSHELRTPLNGILGYTQILNRSTSMTPREKDGIEIIGRSGNHLLTLINDILDLAKIESRKMELSVNAFEFNGFLRGVSEICRVKAQQKDIDFEVMKTGQIPNGVIADEKRLRQVLINLLSNAIKFTNEGKVCLRVNSLRLEPEMPGDTAICQVEFYIEDSGIGISSHHLERIFKPFEQVKNTKSQSEGTGLGLAISQKMVTMMGGQLEVESEEGQGSTFSFELSLPETLTQQVQDSLDIQGRVIGFKGAAQRLLIVDDRWENRAVLKSFLNPLGFELIEASDGEEGLTAAINEQPDLIITDISMPRMDGLAMIKQLREHPQMKSTPIFVSSASVFATDQQQSLDAGGSLFLAKPIQLSELLQALAQQLELTWIYSDLQAAHPQKIEAEAETMVALPKPAILEDLLKLSRSGLINNLTAELDRIETEDAQFSSFSQQMRALAKSFQLKQIQQKLQEYLEMESSTTPS